MKKDYQKPMLISEEFIPNEYVAACYNFKALFHCHYGENNTNNHGKPCATTYVSLPAYFLPKASNAGDS